MHFNDEYELTIWQTTWLSFPGTMLNESRKTQTLSVIQEKKKKPLEYKIWGKSHAVRIGSFWRAMTRSKQSQWARGEQKSLSNTQ